MDVKPGYKQTDVGVIPEDWSLTTFREIATKIGSGITPTGGSKRYKVSGRPFVRSQNVGWGRLLLEDLVYIDEETHNEFPATELRKRDVLLNITGASIGRTAMVNETLVGGNVNQHVCIIRIDTQQAVPEFTNLMLLSSLGQQQIASFQAGGNRQGLNFSQIASIELPLPPTEAEQEVIAEAVSDADAYIESLEQLIAKKRLIKQGAMQELLTGKRRLPGFSREWRTCEWGDVIEHCSSGATPYRGRPNYYKGSVKWITSGELNYNIITDTVEHISEEAVRQTNLKVHQTGTFLMAITGLEAAGTRGACGIVGSPATTNQSCMAIYPTSKLLTEYLFHYYVYRGDELALRYCQGTKQQSYTAKIVRILPIALPEDIAEQKAIAEVLSDMDTEIESLEQKLEKARQLKQGMMQELLTGRIRLI